MTMKKPIRILYLEDNEVDRMSMKRMVKNDNLPYRLNIAVTVEEGLELLKMNNYDLALLDYMLPDGTGFEVLKQLKGIPAIFITGKGDEATAVDAMKGGAYDYIIKTPDQTYIALLRTTIERVLHISTLEQAKKQADKKVEETMASLDRKNKELEKALQEIKTLKGLIPICSFCKKIRDDSGFWHRVESYVEKHSEAKFSHGICDECMEKHYPDDEDID